MLNFTKTVSCSIIRTAQQIDTKLMHRFEKFRKNLFVKFYSMKDLIFLTQELKHGKNFSLAFVAVQNIGNLKPCHLLLKQSSENVFVFRLKIAGLRYMTCQPLKNPLGQVNLCFFFKVTVLNLYVTIMKPEIKLIISEARLY